MTTAPVADPLVRGPVGTSVPRKDAAVKIRGEAEYTGDIDLPDLVVGAVLRSPVPHALIRSIDTSAAEALPGVVCVLTAADLADIDQYWGHRIRDRPILAADRVRYVGDPVAAVAALDESTAAAALELIVVDYEALPVVGTVAEAVAPGAQLVHEHLRPGLLDPNAFIEPDGNVCYRFEAERGELEALFAHADHVIEDEYTFPALYQYAMETHTVVARMKGSEIEVWASCQHPFLVRAELAALFEVPLDQVRLVVPYVGGGFGSKSYTKMEPIAVALARKAKRPVRVRNSVSDSMATNRRHGMTCRMRTAMNKEGRLLARETVCWFDTGAYADNGPRVAAVGGEIGVGPYQWLGLRAVSNCVYTNTTPSGSYRAFGAIHVQWIGEAQIDELARRAGLDPIAVRIENLARVGDQVKSNGGKPLDADLVGDLKLVAEALDRTGPTPPGRGRGVSVGLITAGAHPASSALVRLAADGRASVFVGTTEIGQGSRTAFAQIAAEELSLPLESVTVHGTDTRFTPYDRSTGASRSTTVAGLAVQQAAADVRRQLEELAGHTDVDPSSYGEIIGRRFGLHGGGELTGRGETGPHGTFSDESPLFWEVCLAGVEVEVDRGTGIVSVPRLVTIADVGKAINPQLVERQDEGAALQGIGNALFEELLFEGGYPLNDNLLEYRVPSCHDVPGKMECIIVENGDGPGPFGAKGCGEGAFAAVPSAILNALADAGITGIKELPLTPERVWRRIQELEAETTRGQGSGEEA
jgi:CO/xanthine dehydrogenase Mo-binding subunit